MKRFLEKISCWYFTKRALPYWCVLLLDCLIVLASGFVTHILSSGALATLQTFWGLLATLMICILCYMVGFKLFHTYSGILRYSSFIDLQRIGFAMLTGLAIIVLLKLAVPAIFPIDLDIAELIVSSIMAVMLMWSLRVMVKYLHDTSFKETGAERCFIYGVKEGGIGLAKDIRSQEPAKYVLTGFVSDYGDIERKVLMGVPVYANDERLLDQMRKKHTHVMLISPAKNDRLRENPAMVERLSTNGVKVFVIPSVHEWDGTGDIDQTQLREIQIEDLLPRDKIEVDEEAIGKCLEGKRLLITGAAGSIGCEIVREVSRFSPSELVLIDQAETPMHDVRLMMAKDFPSVKTQTIVADITCAERMREVFKANRPDYVFHAAAYKHVPMMEDNPGESVRNNVEGTRIIANLAVTYGVRKFVMVSTDKAVNPTNVMGCSKRICEMYVQSLDKAIKDGQVEGATQFVTTRFGNVLGSNGSVIPLFKEQIKNGGPVTVTHPDIVRFFMLIPEACKLVLEACSMGHGGEIFVFDMGKPVRIVDLARRMITLSGAKDVEIKFTGLRDGEKLYEEVLAESERTLPTTHPKIRIAKVMEYDYKAIDAAIDELVAGSTTDGDMETVRKMKRLVPEFKSQHSIYESLDNPT